ncbi:glycosyltransferase [Actinokineospora bangkokensis]|uniref:4,4'-diaponeurosporenoate glycosyltransferase n=1 Tax=Actinokineospora bangkokensis TaxID=1193682 RepID=A0A1Q9LLT9_9PSEU|nr:glycosyltransferase [Actinokineospora bangkokensis]OLR92969.1 hypothetical protein BJP25_18555 [Actinokineospora bangkokensis]
MLNGIEVVVPAHDEAAELPTCLAALAVAAGRSPLPVRVTVVADACTDATARIARSAGARVLEVDVRNVGAARAVGFAGVDRADLWFATTDADSRVPASWFADQLAADADAVAGAVDVLDWSEWPPHLPHHYRALYSREEGHVHGANLGVSSWAYRTVGGFTALTDGEDVDLVDRLRARGFTVTHPATAPVVTSARRTGRCHAGFSDHLRGLEAEVTP